MINELTNGFPYSKDELKNIIAAVEILILNTITKAAKLYPTQIHQIQKMYNTLKYPLIAVWEYYGYGKREEVMGQSSPLYYEAFKIDAEDMLKEYINGIPYENPFDFYGIIPNSGKLVEKLVIIYKHLLDNILSGRLKLEKIEI